MVLEMKFLSVFLCLRQVTKPKVSTNITPYKSVPNSPTFLTSLNTEYHAYAIASLSIID